MSGAVHLPAPLLRAFNAGRFDGRAAFHRAFEVSMREQRAQHLAEAWRMAVTERAIRRVLREEIGALRDVMRSMGSELPADLKDGVR